MKLQFPYALLLAIGVFSIFSCSRNDDEMENGTQPNPPTENVLLVKKITQTRHFGSMGSETSVTDFIYGNNQLEHTQTVAGVYTYTSTFHYDGEKVTSVEYTQNNLPDGLTTFYYNGGTLHYTLSGETQDERTIYTFENGNLASVKTYYPDGPDAELLQSNSYVFNNGNPVEELRSTFWFGDNISKSVYTYDSNNNPFKGLNKYLKLAMSNEGFDGLSTNNPITKTVYNPVGEATPDIFTYDLEYNADRYPTSIKRYDSNDTLISETLIEYQ